MGRGEEGERGVGGQMPYCPEDAALCTTALGTGKRTLLWLMASMSEDVSRLCSGTQAPARLKSVSF